MTAETRVGEVVEQITPDERDAFAQYWHKMTRLDFVKAPVRELSQVYGAPYARSVVARNRQAVAQWSEWLRELHAALYVGGRPPSVEAWAQERAEREHFDVVHAVVGRQTQALTDRQADQGATP